MANEIITYKGRPLVRDNTKYYYGNPSDKCILVLTVLESKDELPSRILIQVQSTDPDLMFKKEKILKEGEKKSLYDALDVGIIWLEKELKS